MTQSRGDMPDDERTTKLHAAIAARQHELLTPFLVVDLAAVEHNVDAMLRRVGKPTRWRPHVKTLKQSLLVKTLMKKRVGQMKCATLDELALLLDTAERAHPEGEIDAFFAMAPTRPVLAGVMDLMQFYEGAHVRLLADAPEHLEALDAWLGEHGTTPRRLDVVLDVDTGMHRAGAAASTWHAALDRIAALSNVRVSGLHGYEGHLSIADREAAFAGYDELVALAGKLPRKSMHVIVTSGTHTMVHALEHAGLAGGKWTHQVSPGTLVLSDLHTHPVAELMALQQAAFVASRVVSHPGDDRITLDAGSKALSPDRPACKVLGWPHLEPEAPSEEHRPVRVKKGDRPARGEMVFLVPDHVCTTVNLHKQVLYVRGGEFVSVGNVEAMSRTIRLKDSRP